MNDWKIFNKDTFNKNAQIYKIMSHPARLEILNRLRKREHSVEELIKFIGLRKSNISQHLAILRHFNLVKPQRNGQNVSYRLVQPRIVEACRILKEVSEAIKV